MVEIVDTYDHEPALGSDCRFLYRLTPILIPQFVLDLRSLDRAGNASSNEAHTGQPQVRHVRGLQ